MVGRPPHASVEIAETFVKRIARCLRDEQWFTAGTDDLHGTSCEYCFGMRAHEIPLSREAIRQRRITAVLSRELFDLAREASGTDRARGVDFRAYRALASIFGWAALGRASRWLDGLRNP